MKLPDINMKAFDFNGDGKLGLSEFDAAIKLILDDNKKFLEVLVRQGSNAKAWTKEAWDCCVGPDDKYLSFTVFAELMSHTADICNTAMPQEPELRAEMKELGIHNSGMFTQEEFGKLFLTFLTRMHFNPEEEHEQH
eukprot:TRINITY_DN18698_c0_g1_i1.p2 TRINITY_DN18698_c0_g1~~TRINITY_DN18698_c0_g1_i1.p2  ORF type:complete len:137 (-),score=37.80 TRINITY_DN18698_c0_g1_i1:355-765(-)